MYVIELAMHTKIKADSIRYYTRIGLLKPEREANGYRRYSEEDLHRLLFIRACRDLCLPLDKIKQCLQNLEQGEAAVNFLYECLLDTHQKELDEKKRREKNIQLIDKAKEYLPRCIEHDGDLQRMAMLLQNFIRENL